MAGRTEAVGATVPLAIHLFGPFEVRLHGVPLCRLRSRKGQWLLALLILRAGSSVERAWLAGMLWPDSLTSRGLALLRRELTDLRRVLGPEADRLHSPAPHTLCLELAGAAADVVAFDAAIARGDEAAREQAVALYRGPLLEGCTEEWAFQERQAREQAYLTALETLSARALADGQPAAAERHLRRAVAVDPLRETAHRALMQALAAGGNYAAATQVYQELRLRLHRDISAPPDPETQALFQQIRAEARQRAAPSFVASRSSSDRQSADHPHPPTDLSLLHAPDVHPNNLPAQPTALIGREREVAAAQDAVLREAVRLVTLTGAGGSGKTRLGLQVAADLLAYFEDGVFFVPLASISDSGLVAPTIGHALGVRETSSAPLPDALKNRLREKQMLLLLDNFEQVLPAAPLVAELLAAAPRLKVLVTSRAPLHLRGEKELPVPPLALPDPQHLPPLEALSQYAAVQLFIQRCLDVKPDFEVTSECAPVVAEICCRLDGLPLAIELAAARIRLFSPKAILRRLESRLKLLTGGPRDLPARQQTLRSAIAWSYDLLVEGEQALFRRLAVFEGGCSLEAAEAVWEAAGDPPSRTGHPVDLLGTLDSLVSQNLMRLEPAPGGAPRFLMLETIREYALERLTESGEMAAIRRQHAEFFLALAEEAAPKHWAAGATASLERLKREHDNLRAALAWSQSAEGSAEMGLKLAGSLVWFWEQDGHWTEGRRWLEGMLERSSDAPAALRASALAHAGFLAQRQGDYAVARSLYEQSLTVSRESDGDVASILSVLGHIAVYQGDALLARSLLEESLGLHRKSGSGDETAWDLVHLGLAASVRGDDASARALCEESLALFRELGREVGVGWALCNLSELVQREGNMSLARSLLEQSQALFRGWGNKLGMGHALRLLGELVYNQGDHASARPLLGESLAIFHELGARPGIARLLAKFAALAAAEGQAQRAARLFGAVETLRDAIDVRLSPPDRADHERHVSAVRAALGEEAFTTAWAEGQAMPLEQVVQFACEEAAGD